MTNLAVMETSDGVFLTYVILLGVSGIIMLAIAATGLGTPSVGMRALNALFGLGFAGYAVYLAFIFDGGEFRMFWYAFILPVLAIVQVFKARKAVA